MCFLSDLDRYICINRSSRVYCGKKDNWSLSVNSPPVAEKTLYYTIDMSIELYLELKTIRYIYPVMRLSDWNDIHVVPNADAFKTIAI